MIEENSGCMFVITHKPIENKYQENGFHYLAVGKQLSGIDFVDSTKDNISEKNRYYCELTGLYWIWKNVTAPEVGMCHYRRFFCHIINNRYDPMPINELNDLLKKGDIILPKKVNVYMDYLTYYEKCLRNDALRQCCKFLIQKDKRYKYIIQELLKSKSYYCYNMLYASKLTIDKYCRWLFTILFEFEPLINMTGWSQQQQRVFGYLSEFLLNVWVKANSLHVIEVAVSQSENFPASLNTDASIIRLSPIKKALYKVLPFFWPVLSKVFVTASLNE